MGAAMLSGVGALLPTDAEMHPPPASTAERGAESHGSSGAGRGPGPQTGSQRTDAPEAPAERSPKPGASGASSQLPPAERSPKPQPVDAPAPPPVDAPAPALNWWEEPDWWLGPNRSSPHQAAGVGYSSAPGRTTGGAGQVGRPIDVACVAAHVYVHNVYMRAVCACACACACARDGARVCICCRLKRRRRRRAVQRAVGRRGRRGRRCGEAIQTSGCSRRGSRCSPRGSRTGEQGQGGGAQSNVSPRVNVCALCMCMHVSGAGTWPDPCVHACAFARKWESL